MESESGASGSSSGERFQVGDSVASSRGIYARITDDVIATAATVGPRQAEEAAAASSALGGGGRRRRFGCGRNRMMMIRHREVDE